MLNILFYHTYSILYVIIVSGKRRRVLIHSKIPPFLIILVVIKRAANYLKLHSEKNTI
jgi:hypothetical protein